LNGASNRFMTLDEWPFHREGVGGRWMSQASEKHVIEIRGDMLEGGGQIVRVSAALAAVAQKPIRITNVRAKRSPSGLRPQHLAALRALAEVTQGEVQGLYVGSKEVYFNPGNAKEGSYTFDVGTAGSTTLVLQALLPALAYASGKVAVTLIGGTNNPMAPPVEHFTEILVPALRRMGLTASVKLCRRGFYPKGGGIVEAEVEPVTSILPVLMTRFTSAEVLSGLAYSSRLPCHIVERMTKAAQEALGKGGYSLRDVKLECLQPDNELCAPGPGCGIFLKAKVAPTEWIAGDALGELGKPAEKVGEEAAGALMKQLAAKRPVDRHLLDQLLPWLGLAKGTSVLSTSELTLHALTCTEVSRQVIGARYTVEGGLGEPSVIKCDGVGLSRAGRRP